MTAKEKAKQLVEKYDEILTYLESKAKAKECALIAVDEILLATALETKGKFEFYFEVKKEIELL